MAAVVAGETFVVTRNGEPVAEIRPVQRARRTFVSRAEVLAGAARPPRGDRAELRDDLDALIDQGL